MHYMVTTEKLEQCNKNGVVVCWSDEYGYIAEFNDVSSSVLDGCDIVTIEDERYETTT